MFRASRLISFYLWPFLPCAALTVFALVVLELDVLGLPPLPHVSLYVASPEHRKENYHIMKSG
jgi:hypothetical protein